MGVFRVRIWGGCAGSRTPAAATSNSARAPFPTISTCGGCASSSIVPTGPAITWRPTYSTSLAPGHSIAVQPNGFNINDNVGATAPRALCEAVDPSRRSGHRPRRRRRSRVQMADAAGNLYDGDQLLYAPWSKVGRGMAGCGRRRNPDQSRPGTCPGPRHSFARAAVGDRYVVEMLLEKRLALWRREFRSPAGARPPYHRRRHHCRSRVLVALRRRALRLTSSLSQKLVQRPDQARLPLEGRPGI